jgi:hypothetical protein
MNIKHQKCVIKQKRNKKFKKDKEEKIMIKKLHPVLTYRMENNRIVCLNCNKKVV